MTYKVIRQVRAMGDDVVKLRWRATYIITRSELRTIKVRHVRNDGGVNK